jgi:hypothetical protein
MSVCERRKGERKRGRMSGTREGERRASVAEAGSPPNRLRSPFLSRVLTLYPTLLSSRLSLLSLWLFTGPLQARHQPEGHGDARG